jgi:crotonobetainyl-CoA:carnitine CoA-transferase CaiB-like acyl-CoA transferase
MTDTSQPSAVTGPLTGLRIFDMTRVLAGPSCTQMLGDLGADVIKIERPGVGDDTRKWGPPSVKAPDGSNTTESAYYLSANRNKRSVTIDIAKPAGQQLARDLIARCDAVVENFKVGSLKKLGLDFETLRATQPGLIYCSITGFGQTGPYASRAGYDFLAQGMGGVMSVTGEPDGRPLKVGVAVSDLMCGMHAAIGILAALHHRDRTGQGQHIDMSLLDSQFAAMCNVGMYTLISGQNPPRLGNGHTTIVPYDVYTSADGYVILAIGNNGQFAKFCAFAKRPELAEDARFLTNELRVQNRDVLTTILNGITAEYPTHYWVNGLEPQGVPCGPVNTMTEALADPQIKARGMVVEVPHPAAGGKPVPMLACPIKLSETPPQYRKAPPMLSQHTDEVLKEILKFDDAKIAALRSDGII